MPGCNRLFWGSRKQASCKILPGELHRKRPLVGRRSRREENIEMELKEAGGEDVNWVTHVMC